MGCALTERTLGADTQDNGRVDDEAALVRAPQKRKEQKVEDCNHKTQTMMMSEKTERDANE